MYTVSRKNSVCDSINNNVEAANEDVVNVEVREDFTALIISTVDIYGGKSTVKLLSYFFQSE